MSKSSLRTAILYCPDSKLLLSYVATQGWESRSSWKYHTWTWSTPPTKKLKQYTCSNMAYFSYMDCIVFAEDFYQYSSNPGVRSLINVLLPICWRCLMEAKDSTTLKKKKVVGWAESIAESHDGGLSVWTNTPEQWSQETAAQYETNKTLEGEGKRLF